MHIERDHMKHFENKIIYIKKIEQNSFQAKNTNELDLEKTFQAPICPLHRTNYHSGKCFGKVKWMQRNKLKKLDRAYEQEID